MLIQAHFLALAQNLLTLLLRTLEKTGLTENKILTKQIERTQKLSPAQRVPAHEMVRHAVQLSVNLFP